MVDEIEVSFDKLEKLFERYGTHIPPDVVSHLRGTTVFLKNPCFNLERSSFNVAFLVEAKFQNKGLLTTLTGVTDMDAIFDIEALGINVYKGYVCSLKSSKVPTELQSNT